MSCADRSGNAGGTMESVQVGRAEGQAGRRVGERDDGQVSGTTGGAERVVYVYHGYYNCTSLHDLTPASIRFVFSSFFAS
jgi:hypothetical protein